MRTCTQMLRYCHCGLVRLCSQRSQDTFRYGVLELRRTPAFLPLLESRIPQVLKHRVRPSIGGQQLHRRLLLLQLLAFLSCLT